MSFYSGLAATASRLLSEKGQSVTFSRQTGGTFDPVLGNESGASATTFSGNAIQSTYNNSEIDGTVVMTGDVRLLVEATSTAPDQGDSCTFDGIVYRVMSVDIGNYDGSTTVYNKVQLRE